jgi:hypothetical protein
MRGRFLGRVSRRLLECCPATFSRDEKPKGLKGNYCAGQCQNAVFSRIAQYLREAGALGLQRKATRVSSI